MLIHRHWVIMVHSENVFDKLDLRKCEVSYTKTMYSFCNISTLYIKQETPGGAFFVLGIKVEQT